MPAMETTLVLVKPDGVKRGLVGQILARFERKGLQIVGLKLVRATRALLEKHYDAHKARPFFPGLLAFMSSGPVVAVAVRGIKAVGVVRDMMGKTDGKEAAAGTIRGDFAMSKSFNIVHGSDSPESAATELALWFAPGEILDDPMGGIEWVYDVPAELGG